MKHIQLFLLPACYVWRVLSLAQAAAEEAGRGTGRDRPLNRTDAETGEKDADGNGPMSEVFLPTEEISEDFAVSFPVDI